MSRRRPNRRVAPLLGHIDVVRSLRTLDPKVVVAKSWQSSEIVLAAKKHRPIRLRVIYVIRSNPAHELKTLAPCRFVRPIVLRLRRTLLRAADGVVAVSKGVGEDATKLSGLPRAKLSIIPNAVDVVVESEQVEEVESDLLAETERPVLLSLGRSETHKIMRFCSRPSRRYAMQPAAHSSLLEMGHFACPYSN